MQCFAIFVNPLFASPQFPALASCQLNYLISLCFSLSAEAEANYSQARPQSASAFLQPVFADTTVAQSLVRVSGW
jgi:hypothetical protein